MSGIKWGRVDRPQEKIQNIIIVASGPSVKDIDLESLRKVKNSFIITVNGSGKHVPFADAWFTLDPWGLGGPQLPGKDFMGKLFAAVPQDFGIGSAVNPSHRILPKAKITYLHRLQSHNYTSVSSETAYKLGLSEDNSCINTGNSGYGALNLAYHMRPNNIFLLGIDGSIGYFYSTKEKNRPLTYLPTLFKSSKNQLDDAKISVFNVSPTSAITCFPKLKPGEFYERVM